MEIPIIAVHFDLLIFLGLVLNCALPDTSFCCRQWLVTLLIFPHLGLKDGSYEQYRYILKKIIQLLFLSTTFMLQQLGVWDWEPQGQTLHGVAFARFFHPSDFETLELFLFQCYSMF